MEGTEVEISWIEEEKKGEKGGKGDENFFLLVFLLFLNHLHLAEVIGRFKLHTF